MLEALGRRKEIVAICTVAVAAAVLVVSLLEDPLYEAEATVLVRGQDGAEVSADAAIELAEADEVAAKTGNKLGGVDPGEVSDAIVLEPGEGTAVFTVEAPGNNPAYAARFANTFAREFVLYADRLGDTFPAEAEVVERAVPPDGPSSPHTVRNTLIGTVAGLLLGIVAALLWDRTYSRPKTQPAPADALAPADLPTLAQVPDPIPMPDGPVDLNSVTYEQLRALRLSTTQAKRLLAYRDRRGGFKSVDEIDEVPGFPDDLRAELKQRVRV